MATLSQTTRSTTITLTSETAGPFDVGFRIFGTDLAVYVNDTLLSSDAYTVSAAFSDGFSDSATVTLDEAQIIGTIITIDTVLPAARDKDYTQTDPGLARKLNVELARIWSALGDLRRATNDAPKIPKATLLSETAVLKIDADGQLLSGPGVDEISNAQSYAEAAAADLVLTNADVVLTHADVVLTNADAAQTALDAIDTAADVVLTAADVATTNADVLLTNADAAATAADLVQTNLDQIATAADAAATAADVLTTNADAATTTQNALDTAADVVLTNADVVATAADRVQTGLDLAATAQDVVDSAANAAAAIVAKMEWQGEWVTATAYALNDVVAEAGSSYICVVAHTSGTFAADLAAVKWELVAERGTDGLDGEGSGDLLAANNLSDVADAATARSNLGAAPTASPTFTGVPSAPTAAAATDTTQLATTAFVQAALATVGGAPVSIQIFEASGTWTRPAGIVRVVVVMTGGAGGRGNVESGGAGSTTVNFLDVSSIASSTVVIGAGGATSAAASAGGDTTWTDGTNSLTALGGVLDGNNSYGTVSTTGDINIPAGTDASFWGSNNKKTGTHNSGAWGSVGSTTAGATTSMSGVVIVLEY